MSEKWTKGEWRWNMDEDGVGTLFGGEREAPKELADFWRKPLREKPQETRFESELRAEQIANLDLCAAAPNMFNVLKTLHRELVRQGINFGPLIADAAAALSKARGGSDG